MSKTPYELIRLYQRTAKDADQTEFQAVRFGDTIIDAGLKDDQMAGSLEDFEPRNDKERTNWETKDLTLDEGVCLLYAEIERRKKCLVGAYPFEVKGSKVEFKKDNSLFYEFCLAICNSPKLTEGDFVHLPRTFERITAEIVASYLGCHSEVLHTGYPREKKVGKSFWKAMETLSKKSGEWVWDPNTNLPQKPVNGDQGVDFIVWKKALDNRSFAQLYVFAQCACGNNWETKFQDLSITRFNKWFNPPPPIEPIRAFVTPFHVTDYYLQEAALQAGWVFDRSRLTAIISKTPHKKIIRKWEKEMKRLIKLVKDNP